MTKATAVPHGSRVRKPPGKSSASVDAGADLVGVRDDDGPVAQADGVLGGGADAAAAPDVEAEVVVVAAGGDEGGAAEVGLDLEAEHVAVEGEALLDVADVQVQVAHAQAGADLR